jgi:hypothetical protein
MTTMSNLYSQEHLEATREIMPSFTFRTYGMKLIRDEKGKAPVVVALPNDTLDLVITKIVQIGGAANVAIRYKDKVTILRVSSKPHTSLVGTRTFSPNLAMHVCVREANEIDAGQALQFDLSIEESSELFNIEKPFYYTL